MWREALMASWGFFPRFCACLQFPCNLEYNFVSERTPHLHVSPGVVIDCPEFFSLQNIATDVCESLNNLFD